MQDGICHCGQIQTKCCVESFACTTTTTMLLLLLLLAIHDSKLWLPTALAKQTWKAA
jgi:hypothetical protein